MVWLREEGPAAAPAFVVGLRVSGAR
jgi:hypothetical protein